MEIIMFYGRLLKIILQMIMIPLLVFAAQGCKVSRNRALNDAFSEYNGRYALVIVKKDFTLTVYDRDLNSVAAYRIGLGSNPDMKPKLYERDNRTPEGVYAINEILSMDAGRDTESYRKLKKMNEVYFRASSGYHRYNKIKEDLGDNAYGPRYYGINYPSAADVRRYNMSVAKGAVPSVKGRISGIGGGIAIHGNNDGESIGGLCSSGCIRMYNRDIVELEKYITLSTPVLVFNR